MSTIVTQKSYPLLHKKVRGLYLDTIAEWVKDCLSMDQRASRFWSSAHVSYARLCVKTIYSIFVVVCPLRFVHFSESELLAVE